MTYGRPQVAPRGMTGGDHFSADMVYRYLLTRQWGEALEGKTVNFIGLNPSTATATVDDPTVRRCIGFARSWNAQRLVVTNIFAFRSTDPRRLRAHTVDPVGDENDRHLLEQARAADLVVACWGAHGTFMNRGAYVNHLLRDLEVQCFGLTISGQPKHPLYLPADSSLEVW